MLCLADNDFIIKTSAFGVLDETFALFDAKKSDIRVLSTCRNYIARHQGVLEQYGHSAVTRACEFLKGVQPVGPINREEHAVMVDTPDIDDEAILYAARVEPGTDYRILTGDKRSIRALAGNPDCSAICARLAGRIVCFEQAVLAVWNRHGFDPIYERMKPWCSCESVVKHALNEGNGVSQSHAVGVLMQHVDRLIADAKGMLDSIHLN